MRVRQRAVARVYHRDTPSCPFLGDVQLQWKLRRLQPVADVKLAGPDGNKNLRFEIVAGLEDLGAFAGLRVADQAALEFTAKRREALLRTDQVFRVDGRIDRSICVAAQF